MQQDLAHLEASRSETWRVAITGGTGLIGTHLRHLLNTGGHEAEAVPRKPTGGLSWSVDGGIGDPAPWNRLTAVVHLAGENINQRWNSKAKRRIMESRRDGTRRLCDDLAALDEPPETLVCASAVGYYGDAHEPVTEDAGRGEGFLADVVEAWEAAADPARDAGIRVVHGRNGIVLSRNGGALPPLLRVTKLGLGGPIAGGERPWPWVHIDDVAYAIHHAIATPGIEGPMNIVSPGIVAQKEFQKVLGRVLSRPSFMPLPAFQVKLMFGQMGEELFLMGQHAVPKKLEDHGFHFAHPGLEDALRIALGKPRDGPQAPSGGVATSA